MGRRVWDQARSNFLSQDFAVLRRLDRQRPLDRIPGRRERKIRRSRRSCRRLVTAGPRLWHDNEMPVTRTKEPFEMKLKACLIGVFIACVVVATPARAAGP